MDKWIRAAAGAGAKSAGKGPLHLSQRGQQGALGGALGAGQGHAQPSLPLGGAVLRQQLLVFRAGQHARHLRRNPWDSMAGDFGEHCPRPRILSQCMLTSCRIPPWSLFRLSCHKPFDRLQNAWLVRESQMIIAIASSDQTCSGTQTPLLQASE